jgi:hypothetical protein
MTDDNDKTKSSPTEFDFSSLPDNFLVHDRRSGRDRRDPFRAPHRARGLDKDRNPAHPQRRTQKERRKRIDPTTFEKQYTAEELEFMNAMQRFKERTGRPFPTHGEVIKVAVSLGYRKAMDDESAIDLRNGSASRPFT